MTTEPEAAGIWLKALEEDLELWSISPLFKNSMFRDLRKLWELLNELLHHLTDLKGQFSRGSDHQGPNLQRSII